MWSQPLHWKKWISDPFLRPPTLAFHSSLPPQCGQVPTLIPVCSTVYSTSPNASSARALQVTLAPNVRLWRFVIPIAPTAGLFSFAKSIADMTSAVAVDHMSRAWNAPQGTVSYGSWNQDPSDATELDRRSGPFPLLALSGHPAAHKMCAFGGKADIALSCR